jgi:DNA polymerase III epsilon subunit-like protein
MRAAGFNTFKTPTLSEAVRHFCGREHADAHTALADALGCMDVWMAMRSEDAGLAKRAA